MAVWAETTIVTTQRNGRIDAEFYRPDAMAAERAVCAFSHGYRPLAHLVHSGYRVVYENTEIIADPDPHQDCRFLQATDIDGAFPIISTDRIGWVSGKDWHRYPKGRITPGEILVEVKGEATKVARVPAEFPTRTLVTGSVFKFQTRDDLVKPWVMVAYFLSKYGRELRDRLKTNTLIAFVSKKDLYRIPVPLFPGKPQRSIEQSMEAMEHSLAESRRLYLAALGDLEATCGITNISPTLARTYETTLRDISASRRFDSQHFRPEYTQLLKTIASHLGADGLRPLWGLLTFNQRGKQPVYVEGGPVAVVNSQHLGPQHVRFDELDSTSQAIYDDDLRSRLAENDVLVYSTGAYVGRTNIWLETRQAVAGMDNIILRFKPEYDPAYMALVLNSKIGAMQTQKHITGSAQAHLYSTDIAKFMIPVLKPKVQREIGDKVRASYAALKKSKALLEKAKQRVEQLIEQEATA